MINESTIRQLKRKAMKEAGLTFSKRATEAIRVGQPVARVKFAVEQKKVVATLA